MCAEHAGYPHWYDETEREQFSLGGENKKFVGVLTFDEKKVGGSVGLWLGLGVLQAAEILTNFLVAKILALRCTKEISDGDQVHVEK